MNKCLIIIDMQNDLCEGGKMAINNSLTIIHSLNNLIPHFNNIIMTKCSLNTYCIDSTYGYNIHEGLYNFSNYMCVKRNHSGSSFYFDDKCKFDTKLFYTLKHNKIKQLYFCGLDHHGAIFKTIVDAFKYNFCCNLILYASLNCDPNHVSFLKKIGVNIIII